MMLSNIYCIRISLLKSSQQIANSTYMLVYIVISICKLCMLKYNLPYGPSKLYLYLYGDKHCDMYREVGLFCIHINGSLHFPATIVILITIVVIMHPKVTTTCLQYIAVAIATLSKQIHYYICIYIIIVLLSANLIMFKIIAVMNN